MAFQFPTQSSVIRAWDNDEVKVTCVITCYNHEDSILECISSVISQITNFAFKIVVYDDFSSDNTRNILMSLERQYPTILQVYYAKYNHYSNSVKNEHLSMLEGKYISLCEGDDYWISRYKLQKQYNEMEKAKLSLCVHPSIIYNTDNSYEDVFCFYGSEIRVLPQKLVFNFKNQFAPTASYFLKTEKFKEHIALKDHLEGGPGDFFLEAIASTEGVLYLPDIMSCYRRGSMGSYSTGQSKLSSEGIQKELARWDRNLKTLLEFYPHLQSLVTTKRILVEIDCLIRLSYICSETEKDSYIAKATAMLKKLEPIED